MLMPSIFGENLFDDWFDGFGFYDMDRELGNAQKKLYGKKAGRIMKTDIKEKKDGYELVVDLPGFTKDEIKASVKILEAKPGKRWESSVEKLIWLVVGGVIAAALAQAGIIV